MHLMAIKFNHQSYHWGAFEHRVPPEYGFRGGNKSTWALGVPSIRVPREAYRDDLENGQSSPDPMP